jgi:hypothetical protein
MPHVAPKSPSDQSSDAFERMRKLPAKLVPGDTNSASSAVFVFRCDV